MQGSDMTSKVGEYQLGRGSLAAVGSRLRAYGVEQCVVVTDSNVGRCWGECLRSSLAGLCRDWVEIPAGEEYKTLSTVQYVYERLLAVGAERSTAIVAFGGGVVSDLAGFVAATYLRGVPFYIVPTTLLSFVDASIGGKTAVDLPQGKNLVGSFYPARAVLGDLATLATLPQREVASGFAELLKTAMLGSPGLYRKLCGGENEASAPFPAASAPFPAAPTAQIIAQSPLWEEHVREAAAIKLAVVERDFRESGERALLNLGHTWGHALEAAGGYKRWTHGEAVALGLLAAVKLSARRQILEEPLAVSLKKTLVAWNLPDAIPRDVAWDSIAGALRLDKKRVAGQFKFVLLRRLGQAELTVVSEDDVRFVFNSLLSRE